MRNWTLLGVAAALAARSPAKAPEPATKQEAGPSAPAAKPDANPLPQAGDFSGIDLTSTSWTVGHVTKTVSGATPITVCHLGPPNREDLTLAVLVSGGKTEVGVVRVTLGKQKPLGDVEVQVDSNPAHAIHASTMSPAALTIYPPGTATLASGAEAQAIISEMEKGAKVQVKQSGDVASRSYAIEGLKQALTQCDKP